jgi:cytochrome c553
MNRIFRRSILATILSISLLAPPGTGFAQEPDDRVVENEAEGLAFFESNIRPVLVRECYSCHSVQTGQAKGGLQLDTKSGLLVGGDSGPSLVPGSPEDSLLWSALNHEDFEMPPNRQLSLSVLGDFEEWIRMGAPDPRTPDKAVMVGTVTDEDVERGRSYWAFVPPAMPDIPADAGGWSKTDLDRFVIAELQENDLMPNADADAEVVLRRLFYDLIGLPPSPQQRKAFLAEWKRNPDKAIAEMADKLLEMPQFGERWGRHWLDVARYAESAGREVNATFPWAWRYRDYVIDSLNEDKPYDRFVMEQIAGDLLPAESDDEWARNLVATGFLAIGPKTLTEQNPRQFAADLIDEQIDATTRVFLGLSVACARCHDHKYDPIPQTDYYALAGVFRSTRTFYGTLDARPNRRPSQLIRLPSADESPVIEKISKQDLAELKKELEEKRKELDEILARRREVRSNPQIAQQILRDSNRVQTEIANVLSIIDSVDDEGNPRALCMGVQPVEQPVNAVFLGRGEIDQPGDPIPRGFVRVLDRDLPTIPEDSSGRLELARWLVDRDNPLTARVMANRVFQNLIGQAIVRGTDNFGASGEQPSHPELLDWLAVTFMNNDWSVKSLIRQIVTSRTYRLSSEFNQVSFEKDPENRLLWRGNAARLDAESIRDSVLAVSQQLDLKRPDASEVARAGETFARDGVLRSATSLVVLRDAAKEAGLQPGMSADEIRDKLRQAARRGDRNNKAGEMVRDYMEKQPQSDPNAKYRSVYLPVVRDSLPRSMEVFDVAEPSMIIGTRDVSNTPDQGLFFMNNPLVIDSSAKLAERVASEAREHRPRSNRFSCFVMVASRRAGNSPQPKSSLKLSTPEDKTTIASGSEPFARR